jgi:ribosomal protein L3 glutamine methyltransferase
VITSRLRTLRDHIRWAVSRFHEHDLFFGHGADNAWDEARLLVLGAVHLPWEVADSYLDCMLEDDERVRLQHLLKRRIEERVPTAYLLGEAWFCGMSFIVDERVLVPRSPIGELIEKRFEPWLAASLRAFSTCAPAPAASASSLPTCSRGRSGAGRPVVRSAGSGQPEHRAPRPG